MSQCLGCQRGEPACHGRKDRDRALLDELLRQLYPGRIWGTPDDTVRLGGVCEEEGRRLARRVAVLLEAPTTYWPGDEHDLCDFFYVLCVGRPPGIVELRENPIVDAGVSERTCEKYLRVALSQMARIAVVQEVSFELVRAEGDLLVREAPSAGVYDPLLISRTSRLVDLIATAGITFLDFGLVDTPPVGFSPGDYEARYGLLPSVVNFLFYPQPATTVTTTYLPGQLG